MMGGGYYQRNLLDRTTIRKGHAKPKDIRPRCVNPECAKNGGQTAVIGESLTRPWSIRCHRCGHLNEMA